MENNSQLIIGNWYTQYSAGFWQLIDIKPKYADSDYSYGEKSWKKGDRIGDWVIVKKAFTPKMKKSIQVECVDSSHLKEVSSETAAAICAFFEQDSKYMEKFNSTANIPAPYIQNMWLELSDQEAAELAEVIGILPAAFTMDKLEETVSFDLRGAITRPGNACSYILNLFHYPWELTENFNPIFCGAQLRAL